MELENTLPQNEVTPDLSLHKAHGQLTDGNNTESQSLNNFGHRLDLSEQRMLYLQIQVNNISHRLDEIEKRLDTLDHDVKFRDAQLEGHDTHLLYLRAGELETIWDKVTSNIELEDIYILHGADVALDIQALNFLDETDQQRYDIAKVGFEKLYGIVFNDDNITKITNAPPEIRKTIDKRANLKFLRAWKWSSETEYLVDLCDGILSKWHNKLNWYYPNAQLRQDYEELEESYINKGV